MTLSLKFASRPSFRSRSSELLAVAVRWLGWPARILAARRVMTQLAALDHHELKDIGLCRQDLRDVSALPLDADPTLMLGRRAAWRRRRL